MRARFLAALLLVGCAAPPEPAADSAPPPPSAEAARPPASSAPPPPPPSPTQKKEIEIQRVAIANPLVIEGLARTFENNVVLRVRDASGALMTETFTTSRGEMGQHNPFTATVFLTRDPAGRITVEALEYSARDGSERSLDSRTFDYSVETIEADLRLPERNPADCRVVHPVRRTMPKSVAMARLLVEALIAGERSPFPKGAAVRSVNLRGGVLTVDFNERLLNVGGSCAALAIRASVEETLKQLPNVREVVITANGNRELALQP